MDWVRDFYSATGGWWGEAGTKVTERDHRRVRLLGEHAGPGRWRVLELGCGYGTTAAAVARAGHSVTAVEISDRVGFAARALTIGDRTHPPASHPAAGELLRDHHEYLAVLRHLG